ncbi:hypothetical protein NDU88_008352 [Pleurodeles waltl]|uniref:Uncharacterized protein n=1 Tax=Pleurodeles waltl TaxID=8319 RepID=A0AAV7QSJ7_PLEWA|nr:hypothetical protein NDU88_008352 [Pleurodeles waltl]
MLGPSSRLPPHGIQLGPTSQSQLMFPVRVSAAFCYLRRPTPLSGSPECRGLPPLCHHPAVFPTDRQAVAQSASSLPVSLGSLLRPLSSSVDPCSIWGKGMAPDGRPLMVATTWSRFLYVPGAALAIALPYA